MIKYPIINFRDYWPPLKLTHVNPEFAPLNVDDPVVTGTAEVGQVLTTTDGTWDANPPISTYEYRWHQRLDGVVTLIDGESANTLTVTESHVGAELRAQVRAINSVGPSVWADGTSNWVGPVPTPV